MRRIPATAVLERLRIGRYFCKSESHTWTLRSASILRPPRALPGSDCCEAFSKRSVFTPTGFLAIPDRNFIISSVLRKTERSRISYGKVSTDCTQTAWHTPVHADPSELATDCSRSSITGYRTKPPSSSFSIFVFGNPWPRCCRKPSAQRKRARFPARLAIFRMVCVVSGISC